MTVPVQIDSSAGKLVQKTAHYKKIVFIFITQFFPITQ